MERDTKINLRALPREELMSIIKELSSLKAEDEIKTLTGLPIDEETREQLTTAYLNTVETDPRIIRAKTEIGNVLSEGNWLGVIRKTDGLIRLVEFFEDKDIYLVNDEYADVVPFCLGDNDIVIKEDDDDGQYTASAEDVTAFCRRNPGKKVSISDENGNRYFFSGLNVLKGNLYLSVMQASTAKTLNVHRCK